MTVRHFQRFFGTLAVTGILRVSHSSKTPHFYLRFPADESAYTPIFRRYPLQDPRGAIENNDTVYILFDRPCRVFLDTEHKSRIFGNVWLLNGSLIFRGSFHVFLFRRFLSEIFPDNAGVLEGEQLVRGSSIRGKLWYFEQPVLYHESLSRLKLHCLRHITTAPLSDNSERTTFEDWTVLSRPVSHSINIHIYCSRESPGPTGSLVRWRAYN